jgi:biotin synthase
VCQRIKDLGGHNHMFAFFPERGSLMEDWPAVDRAQWRRVQLGRFIIDYAGGHVSRMRFDEQGRVVDFGLIQEELDALIDSGKPFQTSGCPGGGDEQVSACNRPYGDSTPTDIRSFPFALKRRDVQQVRRQLAGRKVRAGGS